MTGVQTCALPICEVFAKKKFTGMQTVLFRIDNSKVTDLEPKIKQALAMGDEKGGADNLIEHAIKPFLGKCREGGKNIGGFTPYVGWGFDNGKNGVGRYDYGLVGAQYGAKAGPGFALAGVKTRVNVKDDAPQQTVWYAGYSVPVAKDTSVGLNISRSQQDIKEKAIGLGVTVRF